jgi:hypothetical protein
MWTSRKRYVSEGIRGSYNPASMLGFHRHAIDQLGRATSALRARVQRLETEQAALLAHLEGERQFRFFTAHIGTAAQTAITIGAAIERFAEAMRAPLPPSPRGRAGGLAWARSAWRYFDGTFMPDSEKEAAHFAEYERYAAGGRARANAAQRNTDGTFRELK